MQVFLPGRYASLTDVALNRAGTLRGAPGFAKDVRIWCVQAGGADSSVITSRNFLTLNCCRSPQAWI